jgi:type II secretory ATPase GspE/PulE/Tfp pilus assembly ATPase PilB-like protein
VRLLDLGMDPFNFADALLGVLAQRLVRQLCAHCKDAYAPEKSELEDLALEYCTGTSLDPAAQLHAWRKAQDPDRGILLYHAKGCERCDRTGYKGRLGVYELLIADAGLKRLVQTRAPIPELTAVAVAGGMRSLKQDGISKILQGVTDIRQIRTV